MHHDLALVPSGAPGSDVTVDAEGTLVRRSILPGGVRVLTESIPGHHSTTIGAWIPVGSRDELDEHAGSTHFLEHLLFKGTKQRSAMAIAEAFDRVGGESNAVTGKEYTCYYARVIGTDLPMATDVILDMVTSARIDQDDFETERGVILEELAMNDDDPDDVAHERFIEAVLNGHPLGRPVGGTPDIIRATTREAVLEHYHRNYVPENLIVAAAGAVDHDELCALVEISLEAGGWDLRPGAQPTPRRDTNAPIETAVIPSTTINRTLEQSHLLVGSRGFKATDDRRAVLAVANTILGGGMSSRLFQEIRERRGLAYSVYSFGMASAETGVFGMYGACNPSNVGQVEEVLVAELERLAHGPTQSELERAQGQLMGSTVLRLEDSYARMSRLGRAELTFGFLEPVQESLDEIRAVRTHDVAALAAELASRPRVTVKVGPRA